MVRIVCHKKIVNFECVKEAWLSIWSQIECQCACVNNSMWPINPHIFYLWHRFIASPCARSLHIQPGVLRQAQPNAVLEKVFTSITKVCLLSFSCNKAFMYRKHCMWDYRAGHMGVRNTTQYCQYLTTFCMTLDYLERNILLQLLSELQECI